MNHHTSWRCMLLLSACLSLPAFAAADDPPASANADQQAMMEAWEKMSKPGPQHEQLKYFEGSWNEASTFWMAPGAPASKETGKSVAKAILGGRFIQTDHSGSFMGQPHVGLGIAGYDNVAGKYTQSWFDNVSTASFSAVGDYDERTKTYTYLGSMADPMKPGVLSKIRETVRIDSPDQYTFAWFEMHEGKEVKTMEIVYTRAK